MWGLWGNYLEPIFFLVLGNLKFSIKYGEKSIWEIFTNFPTINDKEQVDVDNFSRENLDSPVDRAWSKFQVAKKPFEKATQGNIDCSDFFL